MTRAHLRFTPSPSPMTYAAAAARTSVRRCPVGLFGKRATITVDAEQVPAVLRFLALTNDPKLFRLQPAPSDPPGQRHYRRRCKQRRAKLQPSPSTAPTTPKQQERETTTPPTPRTHATARCCVEDAPFSTPCSPRRVQGQRRPLQPPQPQPSRAPSGPLRGGQGCPCRLQPATLCTATAKWPRDAQASVHGSASEQATATLRARRHHGPTPRSPSSNGVP